MPTIGLTTLKHSREMGHTMLMYHGKFDPDQPYRFFAHIPDRIVQTTDKKKGDLTFDVEYSFNKLKEFYLQDKKTFEYRCKTSDKVNFDDPTWRDLLNLGDHVNTVIGFTTLSRYER